MKVPKNTLMDINRIKGLPLNQQVIVTTGSQGEEMSALYRIDVYKRQVRQGGDALGGQIALVQLLAVDVGIAVLEGDRLDGQADDALHQDPRNM